MWTRARFNKAYVPGMFAWMVDSFDNKRAESMYKDLMTIKTSRKKKEENAGRSGLRTPTLKGEGEGVTYATQISGASQNWIHDVYAIAVDITEESIEDNLYELDAGGGYKELSYDIGESMAENVETLAARFFNSGTATTFHQTRNAKALFATDHPRLDGSTFSNKATDADLTYLTFWSNLISAENQYNHQQYRIKKKVKNLWVAPQYERKAIEILKSADRPDTANRAISAYARSGRKIREKVWTHMTDTDQFIYQMEGIGIIMFERRKTRFAREKNFQTGNMMVKGDQRFSMEINDPQMFYGVVPA